MIVAALALLPIATIGLLGRHYSSLLEGIAPIDLTNFSAVRDMLDRVFRMSDWGDSWVPMREALNLLHSDSANRLYETLFFTKAIRFQYPPTSLLPFELLAKIGFLSLGTLTTLNFAIYCLNAAAVGVVAWQLFRVGPNLQGKQRTQSAPELNLNAAGMAALATVAAFVFYPLVRAQVLGQIQVWIDALFTFSIIFWIRGDRFLAGVFIGLACAIKPQLALLLIWALLWRQAAFSAGLLTPLVPVGIVSLVLYGFHNHLAYLNVLAFLSRHGESFFANNSVNGILNAYFSPNDPHVWNSLAFTPYVPAVYAGTVAATLISVCLIVLPPLLWPRVAKPNAATFGAAAICTVVGSPVAWEHHYGILLPIYLIALRAALDIPEKSRRANVLAAIFCSWILVADFIPFTLLLAHTPFRFAQAHCFFGALVLLIVLVLLKQQQPQNDDHLASSREPGRYQANNG